MKRSIPEQPERRPVLYGPGPVSVEISGPMVLVLESISNSDNEKTIDNNKKCM